MYNSARRFPYSGNLHSRICRLGAVAVILSDKPEGTGTLCQVHGCRRHRRRCGFRVLQPTERDRRVAARGVGYRVVYPGHL